MIGRWFLIFGGLSVAGVVGAFLLYVSVVSVLTVAILSGGILGTFILGYWAGSAAALNRLEDIDNQRTDSVTTAHRDIFLVSASDHQRAPQLVTTSKTHRLEANATP